MQDIFDGPEYKDMLDVSRVWSDLDEDVKKKLTVGVVNSLKANEWEVIYREIS